jgi:RNA polymerase sigma-70 factor (ECF subfamily)
MCAGCWCTRRWTAGGSAVATASSCRPPPPSRPSGDQASEIADRDLLLRALGPLPAGQRAVLVLRYFCDLTEAQTAATLGYSLGSVKKQAAWALASLRASLGPVAEPEPSRRPGRGDGAVLDD